MAASSAGQSQPISTSAAFSPNAASNAARILSPRSAPRWTRNAAPNSAAQAAKSGWDASGLHQSSTRPTPDSAATASVRRTSAPCRSAAPSTPSSGASRVLTSPGTGAFANTARRTSLAGAQPRSARRALEVIAARELVGIGAEGIGEPQPRHQQDGAERPGALPPPPRRDHALAQARG